MHISSFTMSDVQILTFAGVNAILAQIFLSLAYKYADASLLAPYGYLEVVVLIFVDIFYFKEVLYLFDIVGAILVI